jgi:hypothetical protein
VLRGLLRPLYFSLRLPYENLTPFLWYSEFNGDDVDAASDRIWKKLRCGNYRNNKRFQLRRFSMQDVIFVVVTIAFFALSIGYVEFCNRIR